MSMVMPEKVKCSVCGRESEQMVLVSTNSLGPCDLDTRPAEMKRSTMPYWVQACPCCGYVSGSLDTETTVDRAFLETDSYRACKGIPFASDLAKEFFRRYLIMMAEEETESAFSALLHAAWACDDEKDEACAAKMREKAAELAESLMKREASDNRETMGVIRADLLRRVGQFDRVLEEYRDAVNEDPLLKTILAYEMELARTRCTECRTVGDADEYAKKREGT